MFMSNNNSSCNLLMITNRSPSLYIADVEFDIHTDFPRIAKALRPSSALFIVKVILYKYIAVEVVFR